MSVGVVIGRFQVDELHEGHIKLLDYAKNNHDHMLVLLGVRPAPPSQEHPLGFELRQQMLKAYYPDATVLPVIDRSSDVAWSNQVDELIEITFPPQEVVLCGGRDSFISHYLGRFPVKELTFDTGLAIGGTTIRGKIGSSPRNSPDFRAGAIYAMDNFIKRIYATVDIAIVKDGCVLLGRKPHENSWRFPGGFVGFSDADFVEAAKREALEETGLVCEELNFISSHKIDDWRNTKDSRIITSFFCAPHTFGAPKAGDDLGEVKWFDINECKNEIMDIHQILYRSLVEFLERRVVLK